MILALVFVLGVILGMAFMASPKWKQRYREEVERREEAETEAARFRRQHDELQSLRQAAARDEARKRDAQPGPL
jgi:Flp pilus assembly protein TadB